MADLTPRVVRLDDAVSVPNTIFRLRVVRAAQRLTGWGCAAVASVWLVSGVAYAQSTSDPNPGALTFTGGLDAPTLYVFRGFVRERDPRVTLFPYGDIGIALRSAADGTQRLGVNIGVWNSLQTGSSGSNGYYEHAHYEEDFYTTLSLALSARLTVGATYTAYTSPNNMFNTVKEVSVKVAHTSRFNPYGIVAAELGENGADSGVKKGTYIELGVGPRYGVGSKLSVTVPVKLGVSAKDYYELSGVDHRFGFLDVGAMASWPLSGSTSRFGVWNVHGGVEWFTFGDTTRAFNQGDKSKVVTTVGIGVIY